MKIGDLVRIPHIEVPIAIVIKIHDGRQTSVDVMSPKGIQKFVWVEHLEIIQDK